jgi:hypothetical protein
MSFIEINTKKTIQIAYPHNSAECFLISKYKQMYL